MANILLVDPDEMAQVAMRGILSRANHRCITVASGTEAWDCIARNLKIDLIFTELKLSGEDGLKFLHNLKDDFCLQHIPVVVYTAYRTRENVKACLALGVQNYLTKPYDDEALLAEVAKSVATPWYEQDFEDTETGVKVAAVSMKRLQCRLDNLRLVLEVARASFAERLEALTGAMDEENTHAIMDELTMLHFQADDIGAIGVGRCLAYLYGKVRTASWAEFKYGLPYLDYYARFIFWHMNPHLTPEDFLTEEERTAEIEAKSRLLWEEAVAKNIYPVVSWEKLQKEIDGLPGCPVIESVAAAFHMSANGSPASLHPLMDLVEKDPGLMAQILISVNQLRKSKTKGTAAPVEEPRLAIGMLGELRLAALGRSLLRVQDGMMQLPPHSSWLRYWMFQLGVARISESICGHFEMPGLATEAYAAGLIHDIGKLILLRLHPTGFQTILNYAIDNKITIKESEKKHLDASTHQMAAHFADRIGLPARFANVIRWVDNPSFAVADQNLVAIVAIARHLCRKNGIGFSGHAPHETLLPLEETSAWRAIESNVFPSFQLKRFEVQIKDECAEFHRELHGRWNETKAKKVAENPENKAEEPAPSEVKSDEVSS
ncbi:MAG: HDOD domain-containing protein [Verrucomicrobiota bacterium]